jgi:hypothetical protein
MKEQHGSIQISRDKAWVLRWRETVRGNGQDKRVMRNKTLGEVTAEHRRSKDRKTGKLRIPDDIQLLADALIEPVRSSPASVLTTIGKFVTDYRGAHERTTSAETLVLIPELRPRQARGTAYEDVGMVLALLIFNAIAIGIMAGQAARCKCPLDVLL